LLALGVQEELTVVGAVRELEILVDREVDPEQYSGERLHTGRVVRPPARVRVLGDVLDRR